VQALLSIFAMAFAAAADPAPPEATAAAAPLNPHAGELFDRDPDLNAWAVRIYDRNHDGWLTLFEAQPALAAFKEIADANRDGRVTTAEYRQAKDFIVARY
jgi:hypothetical protein